MASTDPYIVGVRYDCIVFKWPFRGYPGRLRMFCAACWTQFKPKDEGQET